MSDELSGNVTPSDFWLTVRQLQGLAFRYEQHVAEGKNDQVKPTIAEIAEKVSLLIEKRSAAVIDTFSKRMTLKGAQRFAGIYQKISDGTLSQAQSQLAIGKFLSGTNDAFSNPEHNEAEVANVYAPTSKEISAESGPVMAAFADYGDANGISRESLFLYQRKEKNGKLSTKLKDHWVMADEQDAYRHEVLVKTLGYEPMIAETLIHIANELKKSEDNKTSIS